MRPSISTLPLKLRIITDANEESFDLPNPQQLPITPHYDSDLSARAFDLYLTAVAIHELERHLHNSVNLRKHVKKVIIPLTNEGYRQIDLAAASNTLNNVALTIFSKNIQFDFEPHGGYQTDFYQENAEYEAVCLFSGGADSFVGVLDANEQYNSIVALNIKHARSTTPQKYVECLNRNVLNPEGIPFNAIDVSNQIGKGYSQTRGLLYQTCAGIEAVRYSAKTIVLSECGTTMYQPSFGIFDRVTYTSDPMVQKASLRLIRNYLDCNLTITTPYENNTKSEMFSSSKRKNELRNTFSCISSRFRGNLGCCYGCAIRRIGFLVSGIEDSQYHYDLFSIADDSRLHRYGRIKGNVRITEFLELMRFCFDLLTDYESIDPVKRKRIDHYHKQDLFRRFALDTFASLHILSNYDITKINPRINAAYRDALNYISEDELNARIDYVRNMTNS